MKISLMKSPSSSGLLLTDLPLKQYHCPQINLLTHYVRDLKDSQPTHLLRNSKASFTINASNHWSRLKLLCQLIFPRTILLYFRMQCRDSIGTTVNQPYTLSWFILCQFRGHFRLHELWYYCCLLIPKEIDRLSQVKTWLSSKQNLFSDGAAISVFTIMTLALKLNGISQQLLMGRVLVMAWGEQSKGWKQKHACKDPIKTRSWCLFNFMSGHRKTVTFVYCTTEEYEREKSFLGDRFQKRRMIAGTRSLQAFIPKTTDTMTTKRFSVSTTSKEWK